jgi:hypothetical protein
VCHLHGKNAFRRNFLCLDGEQRAKCPPSHCSESHFVGLAISACLLPSSPRPTCTADSSAALTATAPVRSLVHAWPCSAPLLPLLPLPFPAPPLLVMFCAHLTFHHSLSCPISYFPPRFPYAFLTALCPFWHIFCLDTGFERLPLVRLPCWRYRWKRLILFQRAQEHSNLTTFPYCCMSHVQSIQTHREHARTTESTQYPSCIRLTSAHFGLPC